MTEGMVEGNRKLLAVMQEARSRVGVSPVFKYALLICKSDHHAICTVVAVVLYIGSACANYCCWFFKCLLFVVHSELGVGGEILSWEKVLSF